MVTCRPLRGRLGTRAVRSPIVSVIVAMSSMAAMSEQVHGYEGDGDQYPEPVRC
jgi:hypothetical protein